MDTARGLREQLGCTTPENQSRPHQQHGLPAHHTEPSTPASADAGNDSLVYNQYRAISLSWPTRGTLTERGSFIHASLYINCIAGLGITHAL